MTSSPAVNITCIPADALSGVASSTCANIAHNSRMKAAAINSYVLFVTTQRGHSLTAQQVATLTQLARLL